MSKITIGKIRTSVGVRGFFKVLSFSGEFEHFVKLKNKEIELTKNGRQRFVTVEDVRINGKNLAMKVKGIDSPEDARLLSGWEILTDRSNAAKLNDGEYYLVDLCGCDLVNLTGEKIGVVKSVCDNSVSELLEVETENGIRMIPFLERFIGLVDTDKGVIELKEEWLLT